MRHELQTQPVGYSSDWNFEGRVESYTHQIGVDQWDVTVELSPFSTQWESDSTALAYQYGATLSVNDLGAL